MINQTTAPEIQEILRATVYDDQGQAAIHIIQVRDVFVVHVYNGILIEPEARHLFDLDTTAFISRDVFPTIKDALHYACTIISKSHAKAHSITRWTGKWIKDGLIGAIGPIYNSRSGLEVLYDFCNEHELSLVSKHQYLQEKDFCVDAMVYNKNGEKQQIILRGCPNRLMQGGMP